MPENKIILISAKETFIVKAIKRDLEEAGFECIMTDADVQSVGAYHDEGDVFILYLGGGRIEDRTKLYVYMRDMCMENKMVVLIGERLELDQAAQSIPKELVSAMIQRPFEIQDLIYKLDDLLRERDEGSSKKSILVVDDDTTFLKMIHEWLKDEYHVSIVSSGMQAFSWLAKNHADLILLDYNMPVASGPSVLEMLKSEVETRDIPVIILTGKSDKESVNRVMGLGMERYLLKTLGMYGIKKELHKFFLEHRIDY